MTAGAGRAADDGAVLPSEADTDTDTDTERDLSADDSPATVVDARGLRCPLPVIRLARAAADLVDGDLVTVWSTDPAAVHDVPAWARMRGHVVVGSRALDDQGSETGGPGTAITVRLGG